MEIETETHRPTPRSCAELGVCQARVPACQGCDHESQWRVPETKSGRFLRAWKRWNGVLWVAVAIVFVADAVLSGLSLADKVANSIGQDKGYVQYLQDKLIMFILREKQLKHQLEMVTSQCQPGVVGQGGGK